MHLIGSGNLPPGYGWADKIEPHEEAQLTKSVWPNYLIEESDFQEAPPQTSLTNKELCQ